MGHAVPPAPSRLARAEYAAALLLAVALPLAEGLKNIAFVLLVALYLARRWRERDLAVLRLTAAGWGMLALLLSGIISTLPAAVPRDSLKGVLDLFRLFAVFCIAAHDLTGPRRIRGILLALVAATVVGSLAGLGQWVQRLAGHFSCTSGELPRVLAEKTLPQLFYALSQCHVEILSLGQFNHTAIYLAEIMAVVLALWFACRDGRGRAALAAGGGLITLALLGTSSRAALVMLAAWTSAALGLRRQGKVLALLLVLAVAAGIMSPWRGALRDALGNVQSGHMRVAIWKNAARAFAENPLTGVGLNHYGRIDFVRYGSAPEGYAPHGHSLYFNTLAQQGLVGMLALGVLLAGIVHLLWRTRAAARTDIARGGRGAGDGDAARAAGAAWYAAAGAAAVVAGVGVLNTTLHHEHGMLFCLLLGLAAIPLARGPGGMAGELRRAGYRVLAWLLFIPCLVHRRLTPARALNGRVLFVRLDFLGDLLAFVPVPAEYHRQAGAAEIHLLTEQPEAGELLRREPWCARVHDAAALLGAIRAGRPCLRQVLRLVRELRALRFAAVVLANKQRNLFINVLAYLVGRGQVYGFASRSGRLLFRGYAVEDLAQPETARNLALLPLLGGVLPAVAARPRLAVAARARAADGLLRVAVHPGSKLPAKRWPAERFAAVVQRLHEARAGRVEFTLVGLAGEQALTAAVRRALPATVRVVDLTGATTLPQLAELLAGQDLLLANDSGVMHLAAAVGTPVAAVFGQSAPDKWLPRGAGAQVCAVSAALPCAPCPPPGCNDPRCLAAVTVEMVTEAALRLVQEQAQ